MEEATNDLLQKFLDGRCTTQELQQVAKLLETADGQALLDKLMQQQETTTWQHPPEENPVMLEHVQQKQQEMQQRIAAWETSQQPYIPHKDKRSPYWIKPFRYAAASIGFILLSGLAAWQLSKKRISTPTAIRYIKMVNPTGAPKRHLLPDSTVVYLAAGSTLTYPVTYPETGRDIALQGEAFFDVKQDASHPFLIRTGTMLTRVLGTSFRITSYAEQEQEVVVATGKVSISAVKNATTTELALLTPGRKITYQPSTGKAILGKADISSIEQWKAGDLLFADMPMGKVAAMLERRYGVSFRFENAGTAGHVVSGTFPATISLAEVLDMLGFVGKFSYHLAADGKTYTIR
ncbi:FecR family protein [Chitinophaga flava]|uniref:FecR protein domain-containing protein n=1 Tax=Chitinophaga flava TaxID=2259036 RepID=A0A365XUP9_9BACT|nr:FecR domain-containing protein [Chitinophaga flava]RBL90082.1 hypothetical protein DF182_26790 [Chitinophaga flava]